MPKNQLTQEQYRVVFERSAVAIIYADSDNNIISWNKFAQSMLGMDDSDLNLKPMASLYPSVEWERIKAMNIDIKGQQDHLETKMIKKNGSEIDVDISITVLKDDAGKMIGSIGVVRDITERKVTERELLTAHRSKGDFLAMVSHELRTPLTAIKGSIGIIVDGAAGNINEEQKDFLLTAQRNTERLEMQINNVLDYQRLETGGIVFKLSPNDVNLLVDLVKNEMDLYATNKGLTIRVNKAEDLPKVSMDRERMKRAISNLVDNAIKYSENGEISLVTSLEGKQICIAVKDNGIGIKPEDRVNLFERFAQVSSGHGRRTGSLGLGLVIARKIIYHHKGDVWVDSEFGKGSTFSIYLPVIEEEVR